MTAWNTAANRDQPPHNHRVSSPHPWKRTGPGNALDGQPKFSLKEFDPAYFARLRERVDVTQTRGIYVGVMLFEAWGLRFAPDGWKQHPFHPDNNVIQHDGGAQNLSAPNQRDSLLQVQRSP